MSETAIALEGIGVTFERKGKKVAALTDVDLEIAAGEVFAVIGFSGAGKSTLVRLINGLEKPTAGTITVEGQDLNALSAKEIRALRAQVGMVFQQFNLLSSRTVYGNIAYPLEVAGWSKDQQRERVTELLHFVGLTEKAWSYPEELSGGQKQRVGIARALATNPRILLADESTSALDPDTTREVLSLLRRVNEEFGITIVVITHEMDVVRTLADRVAVLEAGRLVETGSVRQIFTDPQAGATRRLIGAGTDEVPDALDLAGVADDAGTADGAHGVEQPGRRLVTVYADTTRGLAGALAGAERAGVHAEIVHGGVTALKNASLATFTLSLAGDTAQVDQVVETLRALGRVEEAA